MTGRFRLGSIRSMQYFWIAVVVLALAVGAWLLRGRTTSSMVANIVSAAPVSAGAGFARADGPRPIQFPADHGPHNDFQTEWWYYTGNLTAVTGERFGYQLTFFRRALVPPAERANRDSAWSTDQVYMAHFALTDVNGGKHYSYEKLARGAAGLAGAQAEPFRVWLEDWEVAAPTGAGRESKSTSESEKPAKTDWGAAGQTRLWAAVQDPISGLNLNLDLNLMNLKTPVLQGDQGYSRKGPESGNASYYVSLTRLATAGAVTINGTLFTVDGLSWMDHEWSTSALGAEQIGWDWFSIQLDDDAELMVFQLRRADGSVDAFSSGTWIAADGATRRLGPDDFSIQPTRTWRSPRTGGEYPAGWILTVPSADLQLTVTPWLADQEMQVSYAYWEGAVKVKGTTGGKVVAGNGYVELTGYAGSMQGDF